MPCAWTSLKDVAKCGISIARSIGNGSRPTMPDTELSSIDVAEARTPRRGDVLRVRLDPVTGSDQGGNRPVLVISPDIINERSPVFLAAAITSRKTERVYSFEALIEAGEGGLPKRSKVMLMQMRTLDRARIDSYSGSVSD